MFSVDSIAEAITKIITKEVNLECEKKDVVKYGIFAFIQITLSLLCVVVFGAIFNVTIEALIVSFVTSILRKNSGGIHASEPGICLIIGTFATIIIALISKSININVDLIIFLGVIIFTYSYYLIYKLAPVDSVSKPIRKKEKRTRLKKNSIIILTIYLFISILNIIALKLGGNSEFAVYTMCIYLSIIWQIFSLTQIGHKILGEIDKRLIRVLYEGRCRE